MVRNMFTLSAFSGSFASMENRRCIEPLNLMLMLLTGTSILVSFSEKATADENLETYIVLVDKPQGLAFTQPQDLDAWYQSFMPVTTSTLSENRLVHSYRHVVTGFAARLTAEEAKAMEEKDGFVSARPQRVLDLHTTHTPNLLGLFQNYGFWKSSNYGKGVIIGVVDTGIVPDHPSFSDDGMDPPPAKWKGKCEFNTTSCNYKLIGARDFGHSGTPLDSFGHGTHTSSTAAGSPVKGANVLGQANGTAIGMAPLAHLAMYKVCGPHGCQGSDILAAMDAAVEDGVDVLSLSLGIRPEPFYDDVIALGAFGAIKKGIFVSCSAGNSGPNSSSLSNEAPWILTVGASTVDREIRSTVSLGNNVEIIGQSLFQSDGFPSTSLPLVFAGADGNQSAAWCAPGSLKDVDVKGKIVLCEIGGLVPSVYKGQEVKDNGGAAMILMNDERFGNATFAIRYALPTSRVGYIDGLIIKSYINSSSSPKGTISFDGTILGISKAPQVAIFSSRGPSQASPGILKPDIIGPGVSIVAAWPTTYDNSTHPTSAFNMVSGTSMSCPHLSGIAALLKASHPDWSPAAIKSAIMTTAHLSNLEGQPISDQQPVTATVFDMGSGHVNPPKANDPGLIYDTEPDDYIPYLCGLGYTSREVGIIVQHAVQCSNATSISEAQLNYPSFSIKLGSNPQTYTRTVTNVGQADTVYRSIVYAPKGVDVKVSPDVIAFTGVNQKATYAITFSKNSYASGSFAQGYLYWVASGYTVKSPVAVLFD